MMVFTREVMRAMFHEDKPSIHIWEKPKGEECRGREYKQEKCCGKPRAGLNYGGGGGNGEGTDMTDIAKRN